MTVDLCHLQLGREAERIRKVRYAGALNILTRDHVHCARCLPERLRSSRNGRDLEIHQLFERKLLQFRR